MNSGDSDANNLKTAKTGAATGVISKNKEAFVIPNDNFDNSATYEDKVNTYSFSFWDSTEETTPCQDSQWTVLNVKLKQDIFDTVVPKVVVNPFFWNGDKDNSLYKNSLQNGHIELEDEWKNASGYVSSDTTGEYDSDPKVSGKIVIRGTAYDDVCLSSLWIKFGKTGQNFTFADNNIADAVFGSGLSTDGYVSVAYYDKNKWSVAPAAMQTAGWEFAVEEEYFDQNGHKVRWMLSLDTARLEKIAGTDIEFSVMAVDHMKTDGHKSSKLNSTDTLDDASIDKSDAVYNKPVYRMDVVPYITGITTKLSSLKKNNPSVYARTALGHYSVASDEIITISGFNLSEGNADVTKSISSINSSGKFELTVNNASTLNNKNNDDGRGSYKEETSSESDDYSKYKNYYNRQPNNDNNNFLTDDIILDIWQINSKAAAPVSGMIEQPVMKISPVSGMVGFAFVNGPLYFSMGGEESNTEYSAQYWMGSYDFFTSVGFAYDKLGYSYGCAAGGDINSTAADKFQFMTSRWGRARIDQDGSYSNKNSLIMESIGQKDGNGVRIFDKQRIKSPSFATAVHGNSTNLYLAYYDNINDEIRFKYGKTDSIKKTEFGSFKDYDLSRDVYVYRNGCVSMIAGSNTGRNAGEYVSIAVVSKEETSVDDVVVAVWYDATDRCLRYSYNTTPTVDRNANTDAAGWSTPETVFAGDMENAGEWCQVMVDKSGGIHIAAYDPISLDLVYAYKSKYQASVFETCIVDGYGVVGSNLTLDVAKNAGGKWIPYIGYYATSCVKPKVAYLVDTASNAPAGTIEDEVTKAWEISVIPTTNTIPLGSQGNNKMNVGVWKDKDSWQIKNSVTGDNTGSHSGHSYGATCWDKVYGNGTANPIVGYAIKSASNGYIETAQLK